MAKILIVDDDIILCELVKSYLLACDHLVDVGNTADYAIVQLSVNQYDLIILDWVLPDLSGVDVLRAYRRRGGRCPVLMLTSRGDKHDKACGLDSGADDYLVKPFEQVEFEARVRALLRRPNSWSGQILRVRDLELDTGSQSVSRDGQQIQLRPREFALLEFLMRHPNQCFTAEALFQRLWDTDSTTSVETVRMHIMSLRKKLGDTDAHPLISTARGRGYKIDAV
ncbi:MAG: response regulator transcription factor [Candidatus Obscuribacterales bacterium]|nr:response regulator transcription factor [Candidatus Obscuribacterales bacterium]